MFHHERAHVLDDAERQRWLPSDDVLRLLELRVGMRVADIGAGTGYFTLPIARAVAPSGVVFAVDVQPEILEKLRAKLEPSLPTALVVGEAARTTLDDRSVDVAFMANVWHEVDRRAAALTELARIVKPGGRVAILDWRADVEPAPGPPLAHRIPVAETERALTEAGWKIAGSSRHVGPCEYLVLGGAQT